MGSKSGEGADIFHNDVAECSETTVEIKIKTLDSQTFTLRVDKCVPVPELKEQIASLTGVLSEQQRLICRGKVLKDDQLLSAYHVEDGHTLHLVVRQPVAPSSESSFDHPATDPTIETGLNPGNQAGSGMVVGTFNLSEQGDGAFPDINRIVSAVLSSFGVPRSGNGGEGIDLNLLPSERLPTVPSYTGLINSSRMQSDQLGVASVPVEAMQPPIIPDSLTTLSQYLSHLRQEFTANAGGQIANFGNTGFSERDEHQLDTIHSNEGRGLLTPESLAEVMTSARQLLVGQATECLSQLSGQLLCHANITDPLERSRIQSNSIRSGALFQNLGALLLELGRAIMTLRMGQTPADSMVNSGPSVFVSSTGPNPIMVQPLPFQPGASFGSIPVGTAQQGPGLAAGSGGGSGFLPRNIDIRIRTGSVFPRRDTTGSQPQGQGSPVSSNAIGSGPQEPAALDSNSSVQAIPVRTVVAAVPAAVGRGSDSSRNSIGILYPVLARVQQVSTGNPNGATASQALNQHHGPVGNTQQPIPVSAPQQRNDGVTGGNGVSNSAAEVITGEEFSTQIQGGLEQLLRTIFPGENANSLSSGFIPSPSEVRQEFGSEAAAPAPTVSEEGVTLSNILRQLMPMITENVGTSSVQTQADTNLDVETSSSNECAYPPESPQRSKRQKRE